MLNSNVTTKYDCLREKVSMMNFLKNNISSCNSIEKERFFYSQVPKKTLRAMCNIYQINYSKNKQSTVQRIVMYESNPDNIQKVFYCRNQML
jgi:hypothetical protein